MPDVIRPSVISAQTKPVPYRKRSPISALVIVAIALAVVVYFSLRQPPAQSPQSSQIEHTTPTNPTEPLPTVTPHENGEELVKPASVHGRGKLTLINGTQYDAVANVLSDERVKRSIFISAGQTATLSHVMKGTYVVRVAQGIGWSDDAHAFNESAGYFAFPHPYTFDEVPKEDGIEYVQISLTLHEVPGGNIIKVPITSANFWPPGQ